MPRRSLALDTGTDTLNQSPASELVVALIPLALSESLTADTDSDLGATKALTCIIHDCYTRDRESPSEHTSSLLRCCPYNSLDGVDTSYSAFSSPSISFDTKAILRVRSVESDAGPLLTKPSGALSIFSKTTRLSRAGGVEQTTVAREAKSMPTGTIFVYPVGL